MLTFEGNINILVEDMQNLWKCNSEQFEWEKSSLVEHLLLLQLNSLHRILCVWKLFPV